MCQSDPKWREEAGVFIYQLQSAGDCWEGAIDDLLGNRERNEIPQAKRYVHWQLKSSLGFYYSGRGGSATDRMPGAVNFSGFRSQAGNRSKRNKQGCRSWQEQLSLSIANFCHAGKIGLSLPNLLIFQEKWEIYIFKNVKSPICKSWQ